MIKNEDAVLKIEARVAELEQARDTFIEDAQRRVDAFNVAIGELRRLIAPPEQEREQEAEAE